MSTAVAVPDQQELTTRWQHLAKQAQTLHVTDHASLTLAGEIRRQVKDYLARVDDVIGPVVKATNDAHKQAVALRSRFEGPALQVVATLDAEMTTYEQEQRRLALEAEAAQRRERDRLEREARARAAAAAARMTKEAEDRRLAEAIAADERGDTALAAKLLEAPVPIVAPAPPPVIFTPPVSVTPPRVEGTAFKSNWKAEVEDLLLLVKAVAAGEQPITLLLPNETALNGLARSLKDAMRVPGVRSVEGRIVASAKVAW